MQSINKLNIELIKETNATNSKAIQPFQQPCYTLNTWINGEWVITGQYRNNVLQAISINKQKHTQGKR